MNKKNYYYEKFMSFCCGNDTEKGWKSLVWRQEMQKENYA